MEEKKRGGEKKWEKTSKKFQHGAAFTPRIFIYGILEKRLAASHLLNLVNTSFSCTPCALFCASETFKRQDEG